MKYGIGTGIIVILSLLIYNQWDSIQSNWPHGFNLAITNASAVSGQKVLDVDKQRGTHLFGRIDTSSFDYLVDRNFEWVTLVAWGDQKDYDSPIMTHHYGGDSLRMKRRDSSFMRRVAMAHDAGFKVFVKPHIWMNDPPSGKWRSDIFPSNDKNWMLWKESYRSFILRYAKIAEESKAEMFCLGTELTRLTLEKPDYWSALIQEVRTIYSGKITYAANWYKEYENIGFWDQLDYIGIQAYFPLVKNNYPTVDQLTKGWEKHLTDIKRIHRKYKRNVIFTEMGYKSTAGSAIKPWEWIENDSDSNNSYSLETQANCYRAFFDVIWKQKWFAGVHIWQLRGDIKRERTGKDLDFTPRGKPAEKIIEQAFLQKEIK